MTLANTIALEIYNALATLNPHEKDDKHATLSNLGKYKNFLEFNKPVLNEAIFKGLEKAIDTAEGKTQQLPSTVLTVSTIQNRKHKASSFMDVYDNDTDDE
jgi:hypothetical protein